MADGGFRFNFGSAVEDDVQHIAVPQQATTVAAEEVFLNGQVQCLRHVLIFGALNASSGGAAMACS